MHLFDNLDSGNGYKVRLLLAQLGLRYDWTELDIDAGATRTPEFLKRNPNGRIPTLELDDGTNLAESNAILWYLAEGSPFVPSDRLGRAQALQWMFFEQYSHEPFVATPRYIVKHLPADHARRAELPERLAKGRAALAVMDEHLKVAGVLRRRALHDRRHRAVRLHARRARRRPRPRRRTRTCARGSDASRAQPGHVGIYAAPARLTGPKPSTRLGAWPAPTTLPRAVGCSTRLIPRRRRSTPRSPTTTSPTRRTTLESLLERAALPHRATARVRAEAHALVDAIRRRQQDASGVDALLREYDLSSGEGIVLMCLAEALLRIPDADTADRLIADKLGSADWQAHVGASDSLFVNASTWALLLTGRIVRPAEIAEAPAIVLRAARRARRRARRARRAAASDADSRASSS